jgi:hypothetical protein
MRWEYVVVYISDDDDAIQEKLTALGAEGWELVSFGLDGRAILKRARHNNMI